MGEKRAQEIAAQIVKLQTLSRQELLALWAEVYRKPVPEGIRRELLVPFLAYKIQENAFGGLKPSTRTELRRIARGIEKATGSTEPRIRTRIKPGTSILRHWRGQAHEVTVTESGYEYDGTAYRSLSEIARRITGTRWSGPAFFGLKDKALRGRPNG